VRREQPKLLVHDGDFQELVERAAVADVCQRLVAHVEGAKPTIPTADELIARCRRDRLSPPEHESRSIVLTSGTTGIPKGARVARPENMDPLAWLLRVVPFRARTPSVIAAPLFHAHGFGQFAVGSGLACKLVLERRFDAERTLALVEAHRATTLVAVPVMLKRIVELPEATRSRYDTSSLRVVLSSGSALSSELARRCMDAFGPVVYNLYGSTEVAWATIAAPEDLLAAPGTVGRPPPHTRIAILDDESRPLPVGETGRIFVGHEMLFDGYTDNSVPIPRSGDMMTPGDLGHVDEDGRLFVDARADDMIVSGGENVYPAEIEAALQEHPDIDQIAAVGVEDEQFGQRLAAYVVPRPGSDLTEEDVIAYAKQNVARYKVPRDVKLRDELPRNALGKVLKRELR
jgi:fatty-acyl-CoA synthase